MLEALEKWIGRVAPSVGSLLTPLSGGLTLVIAILTVCIAYRQWHTTHLRLRFDLFEKRLAIHTAATDLIGSIVTTGQVDMEKVDAFQYGTRQARWLLSKEIKQYFDEMIRKARTLNSFSAEGKVLTGGAWDRNDQRQQEIKDWISKQQAALDARFDKFLKLPA